MGSSKGAARRRAWLASGSVFVLLGLLAHFAVTTEQRLMEAKLREHIGQEALAHLSRLEAELNANVFLTNGMVAHVLARNGAIDDSVDTALQALHRYGRHVRNIGVAPGNRITHIYPLEGNQAALGLYYPDTPGQWPSVKRAIDSHATVLSGPVALRQGGIGLISRTPVFLKDGSYWGMISVVLDADSLFKAVELNPEDGPIRIAVRGRDGTGAAGEVFQGDPHVFEQDPFLATVTIPGGTWQLAAVPAEGWSVRSSKLAWLEAAALAAALTVACIFHSFLRGRQRIADNERRLRAFLDTTRDGVIVIDDDGLVTEFNPAAEALFGYGSDEILGRSVNLLMPASFAAQHDGYVKATRAAHARPMAKGREVVGRRKDGSEFPIEVSVGETVVAARRLHVGLVRDITERKAFEQRLIQLATIDALTGALTRRAFMETAERAVELAARHGRPLSLLMLDADHFKRINDAYGHHGGDEVLVKLSELARHSLRSTDAYGRLGGEEFAILLPETARKEACEVAERLLAAVRAAAVPTGSGDAIRFSISIGIAALPPGPPDTDALFRSGDDALYRAKNAGRDRWSE